MCGYFEALLATAARVQLLEGLLEGAASNVTRPSGGRCRRCRAAAACSSLHLLIRAGPASVTPGPRPRTTLRYQPCVLVT